MLDNGAAPAETGPVKVLVVEDDPAIARSLATGLERFGFAVEWVTTGAAALAATGYEVVLLDLGLPDVDGLDVCRALRARTDLPVIVITARSDEVDTVVGLEVGADDYVSKPFGTREIVARIRAVLRRYRQSAPQDTAPEDDGVLVLGRVRLDRRARRVHVGEDEQVLAPKEFDLLSFLAEDPGAAFTREQILEAVWDAHWHGPTRTLDVHVGVLRRKFDGALRIETVRGVGFRLEVLP
ncbi:DNA-binding response regulator, OmpR family, contains REC and winged-helix (wHTH) domain [Actinosynnema pretiosum]|nr:DNA-binding response regulator, OmpR family, contains REC and winged-helix (wHTH) domain [Actinosynnema pretiosum]